MAAYARPNFGTDPRRRTTPIAACTSGTSSAASTLPAPVVAGSSRPPPTRDGGQPRPADHRVGRKARAHAGQRRQQQEDPGDAGPPGHGADHQPVGGRRGPRSRGPPHGAPPRGGTHGRAAPPRGAGRGRPRGGVGGRGGGAAPPAGGGRAGPVRASRDTVPPSTTASSGNNLVTNDPRRPHSGSVGMTSVTRAHYLPVNGAQTAGGPPPGGR